MPITMVPDDHRGPISRAANLPREVGELWSTCGHTAAWGGQITMQVARAGIEGKSDDLAAGIDGTCEQQIQGRVASDEGVEVYQVAVLPYESAWIKVPVQRHANYDASVVNGKSGARNVILNRAHVLHTRGLGPQEPVKDQVAGQVRIADQLLRENQPVAVTPKAFETLLVLIRHSGETVSKDQLMKAIWPDAVVEEANLSQNIFILRKALGDTPEDKRYIVTLPGRGYRFAAAVRMVTAGNENLVIASRPRSQMFIEETETAPPDTMKALPASQPRTARWKYALPISVLVDLLVISAGVFLCQHQPIVLGEKDSVLIADFTNTTGDPVFDGTLRQGLAVQLEQSPFLSLVSEERIQRALRLMGQPPDAGLSGQIARDLCQRTGSAVVLEGSIASLGTQYVLGLRATNCRTGDILDQEQVQTAKKEDVLNALSRMAHKFRIRIGESLMAVEKHDTSLAGATTSSLEALKAYSMGWKVLASEGEGAIPFFKQAVEIDPRFAAAHASLGVMYSSMGDPALASESASKAYELRDRASDNEKFFITAYYDGRVTGNQEKAQQTCEAWVQTYPREFLPHAFLSGFIYPGLAKYSQAMQEAQKTIELAPDQGVGYVNLGYIAVFLGRLGEADDAIRRASERKIESPLVSLLRYTMLPFRKATWRACGSRWMRPAEHPEQKTGFLITRLLPWLIPVTFKRPGKCQSGQGI
jgi:DNA-binding winged helix-turn-helix (wHTH) protein/tetratricopeptide (TPR) repeat protein